MERTEPMEPNPNLWNLTSPQTSQPPPKGEFERTEPMEPNLPPKEKMERTEPMEPMEPNPKET